MERQLLLAQELRPPSSLLKNLYAAHFLARWGARLGIEAFCCNNLALDNRESSLQSTLDFMGYVMGILISNPRDFWKLSMMSFCAVTLAAFLYTFHLYRIRKHLFHLEKLLSLVQ
ncbi:Ferroportin-1 - like 2 [Theobroma cacao]|nr:Ferroportin-1 - like 2 [Theobroma cacao]